MGLRVCRFVFTDWLPTNGQMDVAIYRAVCDLDVWDLIERIFIYIYIY